MIYSNKNVEMLRVHTSVEMKKKEMKEKDCIKLTKGDMEEERKEKTKHRKWEDIWK